MIRESIKNFLIEFKNFALKGNVLDLAIGVVIGTSFNKIISAAVQDILMPLLGLFLGAIDFSSLKFTIGESTFSYGHFLQSLLDFIIIAFAIFLFIKFINRIMKQELVKGSTTDKMLETNRRQLKVLEEIAQNIKNR